MLGAMMRHTGYALPIAWQIIQLHARVRPACTAIVPGATVGGISTKCVQLAQGSVTRHGMTGLAEQALRHAIRADVHYCG